MKIQTGKWQTIRRAFTLLELMMVIAIIGFIAVLTLPHVRHSPFSHSFRLRCGARGHCSGRWWTRANWPASCHRPTR